MKALSRYSLMRLIALCLLSLDCHRECGDLFARSPKGLLAECDHVATGRFVRSDTVSYLGEFEYLGNTSRFFIVEYHFYVAEVIKGGASDSSLYLWNCEYAHSDGSYSTMLQLRLGDTVLVYGKRLSESSSVSKIATANNLEAEVESRIARSSSLPSRLRTRLMAGDRVIYGTDPSLVTLLDFASGRLCYYDSEGDARTLTAPKYLSELRVLAKSEQTSR
jgi:hypothetical protein